jgi:hypothetical protein
MQKLAIRLGKKAKNCPTVMNMSEIEKAWNDALTAQKGYLLKDDCFGDLVNNQQNENQQKIE